MHLFGTMNYRRRPAAIWLSLSVTTPGSRSPRTSRVVQWPLIRLRVPMNAREDVDLISSACTRDYRQENIRQRHFLYLSLSLSRLPFETKEKLIDRRHSSMVNGENTSARNTLRSHVNRRRLIRAHELLLAYLPGNEILISTLIVPLVVNAHSIINMQCEQVGGLVFVR